MTNRFSRTGAVVLYHLVNNGVEIAAVVTPLVRYKSGGLFGSVVQLFRRRGVRFAAITLTGIAVSLLRIRLSRIPGLRRLLGPPWSADEVAVPPGTPRLSPPDVNAQACIDEIAALQPDLLVIGISERIVRAPLLAAMRYGGVNLHPAPLPKYRGPDPLYWQMAHRETRGAVTVHYVTPVIDGGNILAQEFFDLDPSGTERAFKRKVDAAAPIAMMRALEMVEAGLPGTVQNETEATYFHERPRGW